MTTAKYRISEFGQKVGLTSYTLRYYENEGLIKPHRDQNDQRYYVDKDVDWVLFLLHLKNTGMSMAELKQYVTWRAQGDATINNRVVLLEKVKVDAENEIKERQMNLRIIKHKIDWYNGKLDGSIDSNEEFAEYLKNFE